jgi:hypothetical protein
MMVLKVCVVYGHHIMAFQYSIIKGASNNRSIVKTTIDCQCIAAVKVINWNVIRSALKILNSDSEKFFIGQGSSSFVRS